MESGFATQLDKSTNVTNCAQFLIFARYVGKERIFDECRIETTIKEDDNFQMVNSFFKQHGLKWENVRGCTTDKAPAMLERKSGFRAHVIEVAPHVNFGLRDPLNSVAMQSPFY